jgi:hypothetical protein
MEDVEYILNIPHIQNIFQQVGRNVGICLLTKWCPSFHGYHRENHRSAVRTSPIAWCHVENYAAVTPAHASCTEPHYEMLAEVFCNSLCSFRFYGRQLPWAEREPTDRVICSSYSVWLHVQQWILDRACSIFRFLVLSCGLRMRGGTVRVVGAAWGEVWRTVPEWTSLASVLCFNTQNLQYFRITSWSKLDHSKETLIYIGFEVLTTVIMRTTIFWNMTPCSPLKSIDFSKEHIASIFRIEEYKPNKKREWKQVASRATIWPLRWSRYVRPKRRLIFNWLHGVISQKIVLFKWCINCDTENSSFCYGAGWSSCNNALLYLGGKKDKKVKLSLYQAMKAHRVVRRRSSYIL